MLIIFSGLPGSGKSTLARALAKSRSAVYLRVDSIEQGLLRSGIAKAAIGTSGYTVAYAIAADQLRNKLSVVADSVNPLAITRHAWRKVAQDSGVAWAEIEIVCSDAIEHRRRVETRSADIAGFALPTWESVASHVYEPWQNPQYRLDTQGQTPEQSLAQLNAMLMGDSANRSHP